MGDLVLLRSQIIARLLASFAHLLARCLELVAGALGAS
jgi:hypothetical protein